MTRVTRGEYRSFRIASQILRMLSLFRAVFLIRHNLGTGEKMLFFIVEDYLMHWVFYPCLLNVSSAHNYLSTPPLH